MNTTLTGYELILGTVGKKGTSYSEISVSGDGVVAKKGSSLTSLQLIGEEVTYGSDLNQDGQIGLLPAGTRADYGSGTTSLYEIVGVGHGILADGATYLTRLLDTTGAAGGADRVGVSATWTRNEWIVETGGKMGTRCGGRPEWGEGVGDKKVVSWSAEERRGGGEWEGEDVSNRQRRKSGLVGLAVVSF